MTGAVINLILNILIIALLAVTIGYCWLLNRRIRVLQNSKSELAQLLKHFDESTQRASESIIALQTASKKIGENIQFRIEKANYLLDDLSLMTERGNKLVDQLEASFAVNRARSKVLAEHTVEIPAAPVKTAPAVEKLAKEAKEFEKPTQREKTAATLEAVLGRVVGRQKPGEKEEEFLPAERAVERPARERNAPRVRSKAEQELLDMLKAGIKG